MATDPAPAPDVTSPDPAATPVPTRRRGYWQLPVFLLGVVAAVAAWRAYPPKAADAAERVNRDLYTLRQTLDKKPLDAKAVAPLADSLAAALGEPSGDPQARYLVGTAYLVLAEMSPDAPTAPWAKAHAQFDKCDPAKLADAKDGERCRFRAAKAAAAVGAGEPKPLLAALAAMPAGEDAGERGRLIAETCLRDTPPDAKRAQDEFSAYLRGQNRAGAATVAKIKLRLADLCLQLREPEKARGWLEGIDAAAPPEVQASAKLQRGRLAVADKNWAEAVNLFQAAEQSPTLPADERADARYEIGRGLLSMGNAAEAKKYLRLAAADGGPAGAAAAVRLAEAVAKGPATPEERTEAGQRLTAALRGVKAATDWANPMASFDQFRTATEGVARAMTAAAEFDPALTLAAALAPLADDRARLLKAEVLAAWGEKVKAKPLTVDARSKLTQAADEFVKLADARTTAADQTPLLLSAVACLQSAEDTAEALKLLDRVAVSVAGTPAAAEADARRGELLLNTDFPAAEAALKRAMAAGGPEGTAATVRLARAYHDEAKRKRAAAAGDPKAEAEVNGLLGLAFDLCGQVANKACDTPKERDAQQRAQYELGQMLRGMSNLPEAETRFREAIQGHPSGPMADMARLYLAFTLVGQARGDAGRAAADADRKQAEARGLFETLGKSGDAWVRAMADVWLVNVTFMTKKYDDMPALCDAMAKKYSGHVEELIVLRMLLKADQTAERPDLAADAFRRLEAAYAALPDDKFTGDMPECRKEHWTAWFAQAKRK